MFPATSETGRLTLHSPRSHHLHTTSWASIAIPSLLGRPGKRKPMRGRSPGNSEILAGLSPLHAMSLDVPTVPLVRHQMSQFMQEGQTHLIQPVFNEQRVEFNPRFADPCPPRCRTQALVPSHLQAPGQTGKLELAQPLLALHCQHAPIQRVFIRSARSRHTDSLPSQPSIGNQTQAANCPNRELFAGPPQGAGLAWRNLVPSRSRAAEPHTPTERRLPSLLSLGNRHQLLPSPTSSPRRNRAACHRSHPQWPRRRTGL